MRTKLISATVLTAALTAAPLAANATENTGYITVAWIATEGDIWNPAQVYQTHVETDAPDLNALDSLLPCGLYFQIDVNHDTQRIRGTIGGGELVGPDDPGESLISGGEGTAWKFVKTATCALQPERHPFSAQGSDFTCEMVTDWTETGFYDSTFDAVANAWTEAIEPTIENETSSQRTPSHEEQVARGCVALEEHPVTPELAETGFKDDILWTAFWVALGAMVLGLVLALKRKESSK